ncbi:hypothetical protein [Paenibacillus alkalitolerans]|uniref:hypothetical protein n=1 Tax=Paenibacillus alkalitolerans TaxID=2799335 RepID=UPI0018F6F6EE|nr:hypothetical protein [Paenibacillus alkalitolerans]
MALSTLFEFEGAFLHSESLRESILTYSEIFDRPVIPGLSDGPIYVLELAHGKKLILDDHRYDTHHFDPKPGFVLKSADLEKAMHTIKRCKLEITLPIVKGTGMNFFLFRDADEHVFAVCDRALPYPAVTDFSDRGRFAIKDLNLPVRQVDAARAVYAEIFSLPADVHVKLVPRSLRPRWPLCRIQTSDLGRIRSWLRQHPKYRADDSTEGLGVEFWDKYGNGLLFEEG